MTRCLRYKYPANERWNSCTDSYKNCSLESPCDSPGHHCFVVWTQANLTAEPEVVSAGCNPPYVNSPDEKCADTCIGQTKGLRYYCCCVGDLCNKEFKLPPKEPTTPSPIIPDAPRQFGPPFLHPVIWAVISILLLFTLAFSLIIRHKKHRNKSTLGEAAGRELNELLMSCRDPQSIRTTNNSVKIKIDDVKILEAIGSGSYSSVHRAILNEDRCVAIKIIAATERQSWINEQQIYSLPRIQHPNILGYICSHELLESERYWLVLEYASRGSLYSFLRENTVNWRQLITIALGIVNGLSHLHEFDIAHRDFKSKNVLLRQDLTPCISDFGVATILDTASGSQLDQRRKYPQVGTPRYMAPEVLECSVTFTKTNFTKIDVYALSLVLWELMTRLQPLPNNQTSQPDNYSLLPYILPFENIVGAAPDINRMRQVVVVEKQRPLIRNEWRDYPMCDLCRAIEDGWEYDHDARISASCFVERLELINKTLDQPMGSY